MEIKTDLKGKWSQPDVRRQKYLLYQLCTVPRRLLRFLTKRQNQFCETTLIYSFVFSSRFILLTVWSGAGAYPGNHCARGREHLRQVANPWQGQHGDKQSWTLTPAPIHKPALHSTDLPTWSLGIVARLASRQPCAKLITTSLKFSRISKEPGFRWQRVTLPKKIFVQSLVHLAHLKRRSGSQWN